MKKQVLCKEVLPQQCLRRVVLKYIFLLDLITITVLSTTMFFLYKFLDDPLVM